MRTCAAMIRDTPTRERNRSREWIACVEQHAAAVPGEGAASRLVVVGLRPPPGHVQESRLDGAEFAAVERRLEAQARRPEAVLKDDAERLPGAAGRFDEARAALARQFQRLLDEHMLAGFEAARGDIQMAAWRRQDDRRLDRRIGEDNFEVGRDWKGELRREGRRALRRAAHREAHVDPLRKVEQALRMRLRGRPEADDGDADLAGHAASPFTESSSGRRARHATSARARRRPPDPSAGRPRRGAPASAAAESAAWQSGRRSSDGRTP